MYKQPPDFEADVRFLTPEEGGRTGRWGPVRQAYRCDVHWDDDPSDVIWMIWPMFLDENGQELPTGAVVPQVSRSHFYIFSEATRPMIYQQWLREDARFHLTEGRHRVAACTVTKVLGSPHDAV
jgi:hypothetical protein